MQAMSLERSAVSHNTPNPVQRATRSVPMPAETMVRAKPAKSAEIEEEQYKHQNVYEKPIFRAAAGAA